MLHNNNKKISPMQHRESIRKMGWAGTCLAFASSIFIVAGPASAVAKADPMPQDGHRSFPVFLDGGELHDGGDRGGWGMARLQLDAKQEKACYVVEWTGLEGVVTAFHLHRAPRGNDGPHWIDFFNSEHFNGKQNGTSGCVRAPRDKILDVINDPSDYYFNVHTTAHKHGAIRGQMF